MSGNDDERGLIWKLPELKFKDFGKVGPAFGTGLGCGVGVGVGLVGGVVIGPGFPGMQFGMGFGAGCGVGVGFGYGVGKGIAHDAHRRYSNVGKLFQPQGDASSHKDCSRKCESDFCSVPPFLRYGKYCGLLYSGCPGEKPCDGLDACCMKHDACVQAKNNDYLSQECSKNFIDCMEKFKRAGGRSFKGNTCGVEEVIDVIIVVMEAALLAGRVLHKP